MSQDTNPAGRSWLLPALGAVGLILAIGLAGQLTRTSPVRPKTEPVAAISSTQAELASNTLVEWSQDDQPGPVSFKSGDLELTLSEQVSSEGNAPLLVVRQNGKVVAEVVGTPWFGRASAEFGVGRIDLTSSAPQVIFTTFTGGAHCCADIKLIELHKGAWKVMDVAVQDGDRLGEFPKDYDGDGRPEFRLGDDRFLYAFDAYAASWAPPSFHQVVDNKVIDVSASRKLRPHYQSFLNQLEPECRRGQNGACAAYAAAAARLGLIETAWPVVLEAYQRDSDWTYPGPCRAALVEGACPDGEQVRFETYPEALRWFLGDAGYLPPIYLPVTQSQTPSFKCENAEAEVLQLICATPELAKADRELAWLYQRSQILSADTAAGREAERAFLAQRDAGPPDVFVLLRLYEGRLQALRDQLAAQSAALR
ncbi:hypothetical protein ASE17_19290 [Phenylobacterium sp. Root77]|uniref:lysozyme inhibitor LprI family protein n=1 Tax=unclassified Phenylobacterium TaxID=2640670 RepID=UPI0006F4A93D|nr:MULTISPECIES: hypothetical protein [unclassified Phenylobacterium]KQW65513.1 hypothetical protein ASC73_20230 [Phenylobacterium sp. Root1277]KQW94198.1 hypothetical protein ASC79_00090 [Phenylobacterium sp. Root1290]KRC39000.1 hypothetical protein ASE17_19290 [Phenylobacterium sp. Root77]